MKLLSLDLELNQPSNKIIQIGACIGDIKTGEIVEKFDRLIKINEPLNPFITKLTGITEDALVTMGTSLNEAYVELLAMIKGHKLGMVNPITWGGGDSKLLMDQVMHHKHLRASWEVVTTGVYNTDDTAMNWPFGRRWLDIKTLFQFHQISRDQKVQAGLAKAMTKVGLKFQGTKHNALDDAVNTFHLAHYFVALNNKT